MSNKIYILFATTFILKNGFKKNDFTNDCQYANPFSSPIQTKIKLQISSYPKMGFFNNSNSQLPPF